MSGMGCAPLSPTLKLSMCLATMQCRFLSLVKKTENEDPCAGVVNGGRLLDPLWATGEGHNFPQTKGRHMGPWLPRARVSGL